MPPGNIPGGIFYCGVGCLLLLIGSIEFLTMPYKNLRHFIDKLEQEAELIRIKTYVDP